MGKLFLIMTKNPEATKKNELEKFNQFFRKKQTKTKIEKMILKTQMI